MTNRLLAAATLGCALTASIAAIAMPQEARAESPWLVRGRLLAVLPDEKAKITPPLGGDLKIGDQYVPELDISYFFDKHWAAELILAVTPHDITHTPTGIDVGRVWLLPPTLTAQYHFQPDDPVFRPYIGAGVNYTTFFNHGSAGPEVHHAKFGSSFGFALQAGADFPINEHWSINVDVKKVWINTDVKLDTVVGPERANVDINPLIVGVGVAYRF